jgi:hypothetical protein
MPDEHKTMEQRIADIEFNLKKLREEITNGYISWEGKIVVAEKSPKQTLEQPKQTPDQPKKELRSVRFLVCCTSVVIQNKSKRGMMP